MFFVLIVDHRVHTHNTQHCEVCVYTHYTCDKRSWVIHTNGILVQHGLQWNLSNPDTLGTISGVHFMEVS